MIQLGRFNRLEVVRLTSKGAFFDGGEFGEILLPGRQVPPALEVGGRIDVFVYRDSDDRAVATTGSPKVQVGQCAYLKVVAVNEIGAFLDWGLPKDLLVPHGEQQQRMRKGYSYTVYVYVDDASRRIVASSRLERHLDRNGPDFRPRQPVELLIYARSDLGFKAVIDNRRLGQLYANETFRRLHYGERVPGYIKQVRTDGKIDLMLQLPPHLERERLSRAIIDYLRQNDGESTLTDSSPPDDIYAAFGVSKASYKKALGRLYKERAILIEKDKISLL